jgi:quinol-cytochrome oxidoreductase complex cytochrome b subunit
MLQFSKSFLKHSFGQWSLAFLIICLFSGVLLIVPYDSEDAYNSIIRFVINNPFAAFFRNLHYWSAQLFLLFSLLHIADHFIKKSEQRIKTGIWFRLSVVILILFLTMLTGFFLKADTDSSQARSIFDSILKSIPLIGEDISLFFLGSKQDSLLIPYIHHVATFTILLLYGIYEHVKQTWPKAEVFVISFTGLAIVSSFFHAPLQIAETFSVKGPWYFVGLQEILHWMSEPVWSVLILGIFMTLFFVVKFSGRYRKLLIGIISISLMAYLVLSISGYYFRGDNWEFTSPFKANSHSYVKVYNNWKFLEKPKFEGANKLEEESCMWCHSNTIGFTEAHNPEALGCASCHLGNPLTTNKNAAHKGLVNIPGNLSNVQQTCGTAECHPNELSHIEKSLMTTNSGLIAVDKFVFYESDDLNAQYHIRDIGYTAAETHLRNLCANCHLGNDKLVAEPVHEKSRGGGCVACHISYNERSKASFAMYQKLPDSIYSINFHHPKVDLEIGNNHCFGCHSRSGRTSTNYEGWHETTIHHSDYFPSDTLRLLADNRVFVKMEADIHHQLGMTCIDCHTYEGVMGDGNHYAHQEEAVKIQCEDCHNHSYKNTIQRLDLNRIDEIIYKSRKFSHNEMLLSEKDHQTLINTSINDKNQAELFLKLADTSYLMSQTADVCKGIHSKLSCSLCHSSWAPQCLGCHNEYDATDNMGYDHLKRKQIRGEWNEFIGRFIAEAPVIGVEEYDGKVEYKGAIPGMIMTIDTGSFHGIKAPHAFHRLYAPSAPHTTQAKGRNCKSCHLNPLALGFGRGKLSLIQKNGLAYWTFENQFAKNENDGLPEDAWTGFLNAEESIGNSTRKQFRSLNQTEQKKLLEVGACLICHSEDSNVMRRSLSENFQILKMSRTTECIVSQ